ncbi:MULTISPECIES: amino acid ABC transporter permease [Microbacterium]|jgi:polar amino acid transport system permease protein|uniref:amino acid ABC transporter permease n=1 Tax=Microbacterium TaxID=33882 RepID=UPI0002F7A2F8|nr:MULTISPECIES: amino acid ABC transporter permease [Microbacterium]AZH77634.1 amino acid ABC transporter permease [Microbacterium sp. Y-01]MDX2400935.1 amino acid ABC transporter permease [Microbacterium algeriense]
MALRRTTKSKLYRYTVYAVLIAILIWAVVSTDWARIAQLYFNPEVAAKMLPGIITTALVNTLWFTAVAFLGGLLLGVVLALMKLSEIAPFRWIATCWIELFRGLPAILTIFAIAYILPIGLGVPATKLGGPVVLGLIGLILVASAYMAETIRAGLQAVPKGQTEAARSLGMSPMKTTFWIVVPQGFRIIIPPLTNEFVLLLKDTSLLFVAGSFIWSKELTTFARDASTQNANGTPLIMAAILYLIVTIPLTRFSAWLERRMSRQR